MTRRKENLPAFVATPRELGAAVRAARTQLGLSIEQAAARAEVTPKLQMDVETGAGDVYLDEALKVASLCGLELLAQPRGTNTLAKIIATEPTADTPESEEKQPEAEEKQPEAAPKR